LAIQQLHQEKGYPVSRLCQILNVSRSGYYKWLCREPNRQQLESNALLEQVILLYERFKGIYGYRRITLNLNRQLNTRYNVKRIRRLMRAAHLQAVIRRRKKTYIASKPQITVENVLDRNFKAEQINEKWLTDVTELKYGSGQKAYLSAILDLGDNSIVAYALGHSNNNDLVFKTFDLAIENNPKASPLFHSDRGFQYTSSVFRAKLDQEGCRQSMSRIGRCIDNGPMEGFWGTLKTEMYYLKTFHTYEELEQAIGEYIHFYNHERYQAKLNGLAPMEFRNQAIDVA
jgi:transposase InsO family protein